MVFQHFPHLHSFVSQGLRSICVVHSWPPNSPPYLAAADVWAALHPHFHDHSPFNPACIFISNIFNDYDNFISNNYDEYKIWQVKSISFDFWNITICNNLLYSLFFLLPVLSSHLLSFLTFSILSFIFCYFLSFAFLFIPFCNFPLFLSLSILFVLSIIASSVKNEMSYVWRKPCSIAFHPLTLEHCMLH